MASNPLTEHDSAVLGEYTSAVQQAIKGMDEQQYVRRLWQKDPTLWKEDPVHQKVIQNALGWLTAPQVLLERADELKVFAERVKNDGFQYVLLLGMGGSSLCAEVFRRTFGWIEGYPQLLVLDSTDPATVKSMEQKVDIAKTLFIVASKSGTTIEPQMFYQYFFDKVSQIKPAGISGPNGPGENFVTITDPDTLWEQIAHQARFRHVFLNPADIGGRYSALSYFGMVPAALMGLDVKVILERAVGVVHACEPGMPTAENPGARLGAILGELARQGRDKVTFVIPPPIDSLGLWIEQLIAESTGKEGRGILPVTGEPLGEPSGYGPDRLFVYIHTHDVSDPDTETKLKSLEMTGHPVIRQVMRDEWSLGRAFFLWEIAIALAGALLGINPFDQPNVQESKANTRHLLEVYCNEGKLPEQELLIEAQGCRIYCDAQTKVALQKLSQQLGKGFREYGSAGTREKSPILPHPPTSLLSSYMEAHLSRVKPGDYVALTAYIQETPAHDELLQEIRIHIRDTLKTVTTVGYGPRFLHSTGQLHKGGADNGVFIQITADDIEDLPIPGEPYTFGVLKQAQALGDFQSLSNRHRRVIRFHLGPNIEAGLKTLLSAVRSL